MCSVTHVHAGGCRGACAFSISIKLGLQIAFIRITNMCDPSILFFVTTANTVANITSNFQLGFGTFVDKVVPPYVLYVDVYLLATR